MNTGEKVSEADNVIDFVKAKTDKSGDDGSTDNWLAQLSEGTLFVCRRRRTTTMLNPQAQLQLFCDEWTLVNNRMKTYLLQTTLNEDSFVRVVPEEFCRYMELVEVLEEGKQ